MKILTIILSLLSSLKLMGADSLKIEAPLQDPVKRESFTVRFKIETSVKAKPQISFDPYRLEVLSKNNEGVSIQTVIVNGRFSTKRELVYSYELMAKYRGKAGIKNIKVKVGNKTLTHKNINFEILSKRRRPKDVFVTAEVSKKEIFLGEGIDVRYYLYRRVPLVGSEIKKFPSLNKMIKRFHQVRDNEETVNYQGNVYRRSLKYSARVYPERTGKVTIDSLRLRVQYQKRRRRQNPFGNFGFSFGDLSTRTVWSEGVEINVRPLPAENVPSHFTGLVGKHKFKVTQGKVKHLVNEAIELRMEVVGPGALENMEAPIIYDDQRLEKFDTRSEVVEIGQREAKKVFDYTYLARAPLLQDPFSIKLSYFDTEKLTYEEVEISLPGVQVGGTALTGSRDASPSSPQKSSDDSPDKEGNQTIPSENRDLEKLSLVAPLFEASSYKMVKARGMKWLAILLGLILFIQLVELGLRQGRFLRRKRNPAKDLYREICKGGLTYSKLYSLLSFLDPEKTDLELLVNHSPLRGKAKKYFVDLMYSLEETSFGKRDQKVKMSIKKKYFKELLGVLSSGKNQKPL